MATDICRHALRDFIPECKSAHAGLLLRRGMTAYDAASRPDDGGKGGKPKQKLIQRIAGIEPSRGYQLAYQRWCRATADKDRFTSFTVALAGRLYIGVDRENALETGLTVQHAWGMPMIPGSALKGVTRALAGERLRDKPEVVTWLFGADTKVEAEQESGAIVFHDAWWVPGKGKPFVEEIITPHHQEYYKGKGAPATDFDSPIPAPQIAVQGSFRFTLEGRTAWCDVVARLLRDTLTERGVGGKRSSGYGYFDCGN